MLARSVLVERVLHRDAHALEPQHRLLAQLRTDVVRGEVEVAGRVERLRFGAGAEVEELHLGPDEEGEALLPGPLEVPLQHEARIAQERLAGRGLDVAEHPGDDGFVVGRREQLERVRVGLGDHVGFLDAAVALDRRAVEGHALFQGHFELGRRDLDGLQEAEDIGEPQPHEAHSALLDRSQYVLELALHASSVRSVCEGSAGRRGPVTERSHTSNGREIAGRNTRSRSHPELSKPSKYRNGVGLIGATAGGARVVYKAEYIWIDGTEPTARLRRRRGSWPTEPTSRSGASTVRARTRRRAATRTAC